MTTSEDKEQANQRGEQTPQPSARPRGGGGLSGRDLIDVPDGSDESTSDSDSARGEQSRTMREKTTEK